MRAARKAALPAPCGYCNPAQAKRGHLHLLLALCLLAMAGVMASARWALSHRTQEQAAKAWQGLALQESAWAALVLARQLLHHSQVGPAPTAQRLDDQAADQGPGPTWPHPTRALQQGMPLRLVCLWSPGPPLRHPITPFTAGPSSSPAQAWPAGSPPVCQATTATPGAVGEAAQAFGFVLTLTPSGVAAADAGAQWPAPRAQLGPAWVSGPSSTAASEAHWLNIVEGFAPAAWGLSPVRYSVQWRPTPHQEDMIWGAEPDWAWQASPGSWMDESPSTPGQSPGPSR